MEKSKLEVILGQSSLTGMRESNEDYYASVTPQKASSMEHKGITAVIADGVGDVGEGEEASRYSVSNFFPEFYATPDSWTIRRSGEEVIKSINKWLYAQAEKRAETSGLITTFSVVVLCGRMLHVFHVGDTRIYIHAKGKTSKVTRDHRSHNRLNHLVRALGLDSQINIDYHSLMLEIDEAIVMMTDGVHNYIQNSKIEEILNKFPGPQAAAEALAQFSLKSGSKDNITCQIIKVKSLPSSTRNEIREAAVNLKFPALLNRGDTLDNYEIQNEIGAGAMGVVYSAWDKKNEKTVAIKCPREELEQDPVVRERLLREEWVGQRVHSPNLMSILAPSYVRRDYYYLVMELCPGATLRESLDNGRKYTSTEIIEIGKQTCRGLHKLHLLDIAHRDIKPDSIMISDEGMSKIIDYGIVRVGSLKGLTVHKNNEIPGSPNYMAPELFRLSPGSAQTDIFSLGVTLYEMAGGGFPYGEINSVTDYKYREYLPLDRINSSVPPALNSVIAKCLEIDPQKRYLAVSEVLYDLEHPEQVLPDTQFVPLMDRNPLLFWKVLSGILTAVIIILLTGLFTG